MTMAPDQSIREQALNYRQSFIVQAPAGSGKTELLTQRFLVLLAHVERMPEEIVAITFTKKAAAEMRARIIQALQRGAATEEPLEPHARLTWRLAKEVLARDAAAAWNILDNSQRLRVTTIDALCAGITQQLPIMARFGDQPKVSENVQHLYQQAIRQLLSDLEQDVPWHFALASVLMHLDNRIDLFEKLLIGMLQRREQWLDVLPLADRGQDLRELLEQSIQAVIDEVLLKLAQAAPNIDLSELSELMLYALRNQAEVDLMGDPLLSVHEAGEISKVLKQPRRRDIAFLIHIADLLLTQDDTWRKSIDKRQGFPAKDKQMSKEQAAECKINKTRMLALLECLNAHDDFRFALANIKALPPAVYTQQQWQILDALLTLLPILVAHLRLVFAEHHTVDFNEIALSALQALGTEEAPTELALSLDYQIRHLLVDEFQDTSQLQHRLLQALTRGWQPGDGRSLFLVGDPMQSIYRFRQADVGLFMRIKEQGINMVRLHYLRLEANFRSTPAIIDWVNQQFPTVFPSVDDHLRGAVTYSASIAVKSDQPDSAVSLASLFNAGAAEEAEAVLDCVKAALRDYPQDNIAILVRSRSHLQEILPYLQQADIAYQAVDIESLAERALIQDLLSLSYALEHLADRLAWLAILRAPWCGLGLSDLHCIARESMGSTVWQALPSCLAKVSAEGGQILARVIPILTRGLAQRVRLPLRRWIENTWWALGGPACLRQAVDLSNAELFFELLEKFAVAGRLPTRRYFLQQLQNLKARSQTAGDPRVQVMTIHKSKGLEFDTVIIPGLARSTRPEDQPMLLWQEIIDSEARHRLLLAPIKRNDDKADAMYQFLYTTEQEKSLYEGQRLLYVAVTRAKKRLNLIANLAYDETKGECKAPPKRSLFAYLWSQYQTHCEAVCTVSSSRADSSAESLSKTQFQRLPLTWQSPIRNVDALLPTTLADSADEAANIPEPYVAETRLQRALGSVIHQYLAEISQTGLSQWPADKLQQRLGIIQMQLRQLGVPRSIAAESAQKVLTVLQAAVADPRGRWILTDHQDAHSEYALLCENGKGLQKLIIDRTFVDEQGRRWVIDYKSSQPSPGEPLQLFLNREKQRYQPQLTAYARILAKQDPHLKLVACALYFPVSGAWIDWQYHTNEPIVSVS